MGLLQDLKKSSRLGLWVAVAAATVGIIYGYDSSNIAGGKLAGHSRSARHGHRNPLIRRISRLERVTGKD